MTPSAETIYRRRWWTLGVLCLSPVLISLDNSILTSVFPKRERAEAISIWAGVSGIGVAVGPVAGGLLLDHSSWGSVFLVNLPIVAVALLAAKPYVPESSDPETPPVDKFGAVLSIASLSSLVWAIIEAQSRGWTSMPILMGF